MASDANRFGFDASEDTVVSLGVAAGSLGSLIAPKGLLDALSCACGVCCPKVKEGVDDAAAVGNCANELLAGADEGVPAVANMFDGGAAEEVLAFDGGAPKPKRLFEGAVAVVLSVPCALVPALQKPFCGASGWGALPFWAVAPKLLKRLF